MTDGVRGSIAVARRALISERERLDAPVKDQEQLVRDVDEWRAVSYETTVREALLPQTRRRTAQEGTDE